MSFPLATIFYGDVTIQQGSDTSQFGMGDLNVYRNAIINGTVNSTSPQNGSLYVVGGVGINKTLFIGENLNVLQGITNLTETHINTNTSRTTITGGNGLLVNVVGDTEIVTSGLTSGNLLFQSTNNKLQLYSGNNNTGNTPAIHIRSSHNQGNVLIEGGSQSGNITIATGDGGLTAGTTNGHLQLQSNNAEMTIRSDLNMNILKRGNTNTGILIDSFGTNEAITMTTRDPNGNIIIANAFDQFNTKGLGSGSINFLTGSNGFNVTTNTGGVVNLTSQAGGGIFKVESSGNNQNLEFILNGETNSSIELRSYGKQDAIQMNVLSTTGNIKMTQPITSDGGVIIQTGKGGFTSTTGTGGSTQIITNGASSLIQNKTTSDGQHLRINTIGGTDSKVIIETDNTSNNAIIINASSGSVYISGGSNVNIESNSKIEIGVNNVIPVSIGTNTSTTTINGNLIVQGTTTTVNSETLTVVDNIIVVNSGPTVTADGGIAIHRFQYANNTNDGDVVSDSPEEANIVVGVSGNSATTVYLQGLQTKPDDHYKDWWLKIVSGTGQNQVRKIKSYNGTTKIATIYGDADEINTGPYIIGSDFLTTPDSTSKCNLYPCEYVMNIWDESAKEFAFVCSSSVSTTGTLIAHYADLHVNDFIANDIHVNTVNNSSADRAITLELNNNSTSPVNIIGFSNDTNTPHGVYTVMVSPEDPLKPTAHGIFMIGRSVMNLPGSVVRIISVKGSNDEQIDMIWPAGQVPQLLYRQAPNTGNTTRFKLKIIGI